MLKAGVLLADTTEVKLQNLTGGELEVTGVSVVTGNYSNCTVDGQASGAQIGAGREMLLECDFSGGEVNGSIKIDYQDFSDLQRSATIKISGGPTGEADPGLPENTTGISTCAELQAMNEDLAGDYALLNHIDCSETSTWNGGAGFDPVGDTTTLFSGSLDGQGFNVNNLHINRPSEDNVGLFGFSDGGSFSNLGILNADITGKSHAGAFAGAVYNGTIANCRSSGSVIGEDTTGGLAGTLAWIDVSDSYSTASVVATTDRWAGGFGGFIWPGTVTRCYATGSVSGIWNVGGFGGSVFNTQISDSYATGSVSGTKYIGGFAGVKTSNAKFDRVYSTGTVSGSEDVGGLLGYDEDSTPGELVVDSYWDTESSGLGSSVGGTGKTTAEMKQEATFTNWDFSTVWNINEGSSYPFLR